MKIGLIPKLYGNYDALIKAVRNMYVLHEYHSQVFGSAPKYMTHIISKIYKNNEKKVLRPRFSGQPLQPLKANYCFSTSSYTNKRKTLMFKWKKLGRVFNPTEIKSGNWIKEYAQAPSVAIFDNFIRVYFSARSLPDPKGQYISRLAYVDLKRDNLLEIINVCKEPILQLGDIGTFDEFGTYPASVIKTKEDIRVYYAGWTRCESVPFNAAIGVAFSRDNGATFTKMGSGPVLSYSPDEPFVLGSPKIRKYNNTWFLWYSSGKKWIKNNDKPEPVYKIRMAQSTDGINWIKHGKDLLESVLEENECQASPDVFLYKGLYHMFYSYRYNLNFREAKRGYRIGYAFSSDLLNWTRNDAKAGIEVSTNGWDSESISYPHVFELDGEVYMLYQGNEIGRYGFGLAQLTDYKL